jgi:hypothetical protein
VEIRRLGVVEVVESFASLRVVATSDPRERPLIGLGSLSPPSDLLRTLKIDSHAAEPLVATH